MTRACRRSGGVAVVAVASVIGLAGCAGPSSPQVASLGGGNTHGSGSTTTTLPKGNPTKLLDEWATCMRSHGDPGQTDPTVDANKVIHITFPPGGGGGVDLKKGANTVCGSYLTAASTALRGGKPLPKPDPAKLEKFSHCMQTHGVPDFPSPSNGGLQIHASGPNSDLNPNNPTFQKASKLCAKKTGVPAVGTGTPPPGSIEASGSGPQPVPGGNGGAGAGSQKVQIG